MWLRGGGGEASRGRQGYSAPNTNMTPDEQLEHNAQSVASVDEEFPYCLRCHKFVYVTEVDTCFICGGREICWRKIDPPERKGVLGKVWRWLRA